jgi:hypothetical protein
VACDRSSTGFTTVAKDGSRHSEPVRSAWGILVRNTAFRRIRVDQRACGPRGCPAHPRTPEPPTAETACRVASYESSSGNCHRTSGYLLNLCLRETEPKCRRDRDAGGGLRHGDGAPGAHRPVGGSPGGSRGVSLRSAGRCSGGGSRVALTLSAISAAAKPHQLRRNRPRIAIRTVTPNTGTAATTNMSRT